MLRIHFAFDDLARTRLAENPDPMWEIVLSLQLLQNREGAVAFRDWRSYARGRLGPWARGLMVLAPHAAYFPDFVTPAYGGAQVEEGIDMLLSTPGGRMRKELGILAEDRVLPSWCRRMADGDLDTLARLGEAFHAYHRAVVKPYWPAIQASVTADRSRTSYGLLYHGPETLLANLGPAIRWRAPILECDYPTEQDLHLGGRGLLLIPSFFCWRTPVVLADPDLRPVLVYPIAHDLVRGPVAADAPSRAMRSLSDLLGGTRARVLASIEDGCTTTELSRRAGTSIPSASRHATILRDAALINTERYGGEVKHTLTPLGNALLTHALPAGFNVSGRGLSAQK